MGRNSQLFMYAYRRVHVIVHSWHHSNCTQLISPEHTAENPRGTSKPESPLPLGLTKLLCMRTGGYTFTYYTQLHHNLSVINTHEDPRGASKPESPHPLTSPCLQGAIMYAYRRALVIVHSCIAVLHNLSAMTTHTREPQGDQFPYPLASPSPAESCHTQAGRRGEPQGEPSAQDWQTGQGTSQAPGRREERNSMRSQRSYASLHDGVSSDI